MFRVDDMPWILGPFRPFSVILAAKEYFVGTEVDQPKYHVLLESGSVGPYDSRTITGMRIKHALSSELVLVRTDGARLTVRDLLRQRAAKPFRPERAGGASRARATFSAALIEIDEAGLEIPRFQGKLEARVHDEVLRLAGRFRRWFAWKEDRIKIPISDIVHAQIQGSRVDLWVRCGDAHSLQRVALDLFTYEAAGELVEWLPEARAVPEASALAVQSRPARLSVSILPARARKAAAVGLVVALGLVLMALVYRGVS